MPTINQGFLLRLYIKWIWGIITLDKRKLIAFSGRIVIFWKQGSYTLKIKSNLNKIKINHHIMPFEKQNLEKGNLDSSQKALFWLASFYDYIILFLKNLGDLLLSIDIFPVGSSCPDSAPCHCSSQSGPCCVHDSFLLGPVTPSFPPPFLCSCNYPTPVLIISLPSPPNGNTVRVSAWISASSIACCLSLWLLFLGQHLWDIISLSWSLSVHIVRLGWQYLSHRPF